MLPLARMFHVKHQAWRSDLHELGLELEDGQIEALVTFEELLQRRALPRGMVSAADAPKLWERHIRDGLRAAREIPPESRVADLGSGAGLPGLTLAIAVPGSSFLLVEVRRGRVAFLESVSDDLGLQNVRIFLGSVEDAEKAAFDVCLARAFGTTKETWASAEPLLRPSGHLIYWAGERFTPMDLGDLPVKWRVSTPSGLAEPGPLVIMSRQ